MARGIVLTVSVLFVAGFAFLTLREILRAGITPGIVFSVLILIVLGAGVIGALASPPDD